MKEFAPYLNLHFIVIERTSLPSCAKGSYFFCQLTKVLEARGSRCEDETGLPNDKLTVRREKNRFYKVDEVKKKKMRKQMEVC